MSRTWSNTSLEMEALNSLFNLSDGHTRISPPPSLLGVISSGVDVFSRAASTSQSAVENEFFDAFQVLSKQVFPRRPLLSYSASALVSVISTFLRVGRYRVEMVEPSFDNIRDLLRSAGVEVVPLAEDLVPDGLAEAASSRRAIWIASPNNPTGRTLSAEEYRTLAEWCAKSGALLVVDHCFRFYSEITSSFSQYEVLESVEALEYIVLEDTGKTVPLLDMKAALLVSSSAVHLALGLLNEDLLLNVSPFVLGVITESMMLLSGDEMRTAIHEVVARNRDYATTVLSASGRQIRLRSAGYEAPFLWYRSDTAGGGERIAAEARARGVHILPGTKFFSVSPSPGADYFRIPLARDADVFRLSIDALDQSMPR